MIIYEYNIYIYIIYIYIMSIVHGIVLYYICSILYFVLWCFLYVIICKLHMHVHILRYTYTHVHIYIQICKHIGLHSICLPVCLPTELPAYINIHTVIHTHLHACMQAYMHTYLKIYTYVCYPMGISWRFMKWVGQKLCMYHWSSLLPMPKWWICAGIETNDRRN